MDIYNVGSQKQQSACNHVAPLGQIILILSQPVLALLLPEMNAHEKSMDYFIELLRKDTVSFILLIRFRKTLLSIEKKQEWLTISPRGNTLASTGCRKSLLNQ
jgi:hypothetical protein